MASSLEVQAWRIVKRKHAGVAFTGEGSRLFGGRWSSPGSALIYTAQSRSLAALEMLVHLDRIELLDNYVLFEVHFDSSLSKDVRRSDLPRNWRDDPPPARLKEIGDAWITEGSSAVLRVPSALIAGEHNHLLNPRHPAFPRLRIGKPLPFQFDPRLAR